MSDKQNLSRKITLLGILTALCTVARLVVIPLPNVQPVTAILMLVSLNWSVGAGLVLATLTMLVSNLFLGFGLWTVPQIAAYLVCILTVGVMQKFLPLKQHLWLQVLLCTALGYEYGWCVSLGLAILGSAPAFWPYWLSGLLFDTYHAMGNFVFYPLLAPVLSKLLQKYLTKSLI